MSVLTSAALATLVVSSTFLLLSNDQAVTPPEPQSALMEWSLLGVILLVAALPMLLWAWLRRRNRTAQRRIAETLDEALRQLTARE